MANMMHIEVFSKGGAAWNAWRKENPAVKPNLDELRACDVVGKAEDDFLIVILSRLILMTFP